jgi:hypothetical protein
MGRASLAAWWCIEVLVPALSVFAGLALLSVAGVAQVTGTLPRAEQMRVFLGGVACWAGGIVWGALVNNGIPGLRDP